MNVLTTSTIFTFVQLVTASLAQTCGQRQIITQHEGQAGAWPWHGVMLIRLQMGSFEYTCGVTILTERFVITAAHCTISDNRYQIPVNEVYVIVGVTNLDSPGHYAVMHYVTRIIMHEEFDMETLENNVALIELNSIETFNDYVQPICIWQGDTSLLTVVSQKGYLVGWPANREGRWQSTLNEITMSIVSKKECIDSDRSVFLLHFFEKQTFCAEYQIGTVVTTGHSGGGLFLRVGNSWVLRGILSSAKADIDGNVDPTSYVVFMDVANYANWIKKYVTITTNNTIDTQDNRSDRNTSNFISEKGQQKHTIAQNCGKKHIVTQRLISNAWPWHGALFYSLKNGETFYSCGVTIVTERFVITAASCTLVSNKPQYQACYIKVGLTNLASPEQHAQQHKVARIFQHDEFDNVTYENNIALIELYTDISYNDYIQPICLWQGDSNLRKVVSQIGYIVGWEDTKQNLALPQVFNELTMKIVSKAECIRSDGVYVNFYFEPTTFCAEIRNGTDLSSKDIGGGLVLKDDNSWVLRGILSFGIINSTTKGFDSESYVIFTDVSKYIDWINEVINIFCQKEQIVARTVEPADTTDTNNATFVEVTSEFTNLKKCGQKKISVRESILMKHKALPGAWPWHGAMFHRFMGGQASYACGVTILTEWFVITAAYCTIDLPAHRIFVNVGLTHLNSSEPHVQHHEVIRIIQHKGFNKTTYENNIALIELRTVIIYNDYVQPICLWEDDSELRNIESQEGYAAGLRDFENDLNEVTLTTVSEVECYLNDTNFFSSFYFETKTFCAKFGNEAKSSSKYVGGGLFVLDDNSWILRGILSYGKINSTTTNFDLESYVILTNVSNYIEWIKLNTIKTKNNAFEIEPIIHASNVKPVETTNTNNSTFVEVTKQSTNPKKCGQRKFDVQKLIFNGYKTLPGAWPWHGAMFHRLMAGQTSYACGVTVLSERFVITAAHCTFDKQEGQRLPADRAYVKLGLTNLDSPERHVQQHSVVIIIRHEDYDEETFENDISLLKLHAEITYSDYVQPVCLWQGDMSLKNIVSEIGYTVGWGFNDYGLPKDLNEATMPIVSKETCKDLDVNHFRRFYFEPKTFCAGYRNGTIAAPGDSGGGLFLRQGSSWVLRGIISNTKLNPNTLKVDPNSFVYFVDVSYYLDWIRTQSVDVLIAQTDSVDVSIARTDFLGSKLLLICLVAGIVVVLLVAFSCNICRIKNCKVNLNCSRTRGDANRNTYNSNFVING